MEDGGEMTRLESLERWSAPAFLVAGALFTGFAVRNGIIAFGSGFSEQVTAALYLVFVVPAELAAYMGLLGLHARLSDSAPRLAGGGAVLVGVAAVAVLGFGGAASTALLGSGPPEPPAIAGLLFLVTILTTILGFVLFGVASLRADVPSRRLGLVLLVPPTTYFLMMAGTVVGYTPEWSTFVLSAGQAAAHLGIGVVLRNGDVAADRAEPAPDSVA